MPFLDCLVVHMFTKGVDECSSTMASPLIWDESLLEGERRSFVSITIFSFFHLSPKGMK